LTEQTYERDERTFCVSLGVFDGPLDLLLNLVKERQLDIATVPLAMLAQQYLDYIALLEAFDIEIAAGYLSIAATLVFLKSKSLLPPIPAEFVAEGEESAEEVEERLRRRLITYSKYRGAAEELRARREEAAAFYYRDAGDPGTQIVQRYRLSSARLVAALSAALRAARPETRTIARQRVSLAGRMEYVVRRVRTDGTVNFSDLCRGLDREGVVVTFLAILELIRRLRITFRQNGPHDVLRLLPYEVMTFHERLEAG
jgi:segregation and condensation protein A